MIRQFDKRDAGACARVVQACVEADPNLPPELRTRIFATITESAMQEKASLFYLAVAEIDEGVVGLGGVDMNEIRLLYVFPGLQGQGIGRALLEHLESMVPPALFRDIFLYSTRFAEGFYRSRGYVSEGECLHDILGEPMLSVFMRKDIF